ncbi:MULTISPECIES: hypothetical protein [Corallococcus]|uniref:hypothetical protein n=1 Tax=Corallococcus TaxID=83461 RepID=UPI0011C3A73E|nr:MULTISPECIES: hypothetical protein [Corallococcus]
MARKKSPKAVAVKIVGKKPTTLGARKVGEKIRISQEVTSREGSTAVVRFETTTVQKRAQGRKAKSPDWMENPQLPAQLLTAFSKAVNRAKSENAK